MTKTVLVPLAAAAILALSAPVFAQTSSGGGRRSQPPAPTKPTAGQAARHAFQAPQGFSVVLVLGDLQGGATSDNVPAAARKALSDMKDFLPYKSYRLLDVQWTLCCSRGAETSVASRLRGADGQDYELLLSSSIDLQRDRLGVRFLLREPSRATAHDEPSEVTVQLQREVERVEKELEAATQKARSRAEVGVGGPADEDRTVRELRSKRAEMSIRLAESRRDSRNISVQSRSSKASAVIDTAFTMAVGETVVVGTSRVAGGDKALIALLTAVPQKTSESPAAAAQRRQP